jgi:xanthine dehydrogenase FAD-binding subunit
MRDVILPVTLDELLGILGREPAAAVYAGGTDLLVKIRQGSADPRRLVCIERVAELRGVIDEGAGLWIGPATTHASLMDNALIRKHLPVLAQAIGTLGSPPIRHMGTIGGNIVTASPAGDTLPPLYLADAEVEIRTVGSRRVQRIADFVRGPGEVDLQPGEIVSGIRVRKTTGQTIHHFDKVGRRTSQACTVVSLAALLGVSREGVIEQARLAWGAVGPTVVTSKDVDEALVGKRLSVETLAEVAPLVEEAVSPVDDVRASAAYRRSVASALVMRLAQYALEGAG